MNSEVHVPALEDAARRGQHVQLALLRHVIKVVEQKFPAGALLKINMLFCRRCISGGASGFGYGPAEKPRGFINELNVGTSRLTLFRGDDLTLDGADILRRIANGISQFFLRDFALTPRGL